MRPTCVLHIEKTLNQPNLHIICHYFGKKCFFFNIGVSFISDFYSIYIHFKKGPKGKKWLISSKDDLSLSSLLLAVYLDRLKRNKGIITIPLMARKNNRKRKNLKPVVLSDIGETNGKKNDNTEKEITFLPGLSASIRERVGPPILSTGKENKKTITRTKIRFITLLLPFLAYSEMTLQCISLSWVGVASAGAATQRRRCTPSTSAFKRPAPVSSSPVARACCCPLSGSRGGEEPPPVGVLFHGRRPPVGTFRTAHNPCYTLANVAVPGFG